MLSLLCWGRALTLGLAVRFVGIIKEVFIFDFLSSVKTLSLIRISKVVFTSPRDDINIFIWTDLAFTSITNPMIEICVKSERI